MSGPYRQCQEHGWLEIREYVVNDSTGAKLCPICEKEVAGRYPEVSNRRGPGGPTHAPREKFLEAVETYYQDQEDQS